MNNLEQRLDYIFRDKNLLTQALTHSSVTADIHRNYERLEFLGDRILGVMVADMLCKTFVDEPEGNLARRFVQLVCKETVADVVRQLNIIPFIRVANDEVRDKDNVLCDVGEALIAAIYIDSQSLETARNFVERWWKPLIDKKSQPPKDYKTQLQEVAAQRKLDVPSYAIIDKKGPEHAPQFEVSVALDQDHIAHGIGSSKKHAEQEAAHALLKMLGAIDE